MSFKERLLSRLPIRSKDIRPNTDVDEEVLFEKFYKALKLGSPSNQPNTPPSSAGISDKPNTYRTIPKFYRKLPKNADSISQKLCEEARTVFLKKRSRELLDNNELKVLWALLETSYTLPIINNTDKYISYDDYVTMRDLAGAKCRHYLTASVFARLQSVSDFPGRVSIMSLFNYVMRKVWLQQTRIGLSLHDSTGQGYLRESELEAYTLELIPNLPQLEGLERSFHSFYVCTAVRKFFFFLDPHGTGKIRIRDILSCSYLDDLLELRDDETPKDSLEINWFSAPSALSVYGHYLNLDKDHNGMLSKAELAGYGSGTLTSVFLDRVFAECHTYNGEMDYKAYLDFVLALENRHEPQALHYLFRILDFEHTGYLTSFSLNYFFKGITYQIVAHRAERVDFEDVKDQVFDMVKPKDPFRITLKDLINCGQGETVISILIEFHKFWAYDNRELIAGDTSQTDEQPPPFCMAVQESRTATAAQDSVAATSLDSAV